MNISKLVLKFTESVIRRSTVWSQQYNAVNLSQGFPEDETPMELKQAAIDAILENWNQYSDTWGRQDFREAIAEKMKTFNGLDVNGVDNVTVTCGATEAMIATLLGVTNPGDEVIIFEPIYENFRPQCFIARVKPVLVQLHEPEFSFYPDELKKAFSNRTRAIIINTPNNPCGKVFSREELDHIATLCLKYDVIAITDEVYERLVFDGRKHISIATLEGMSERTVTVNSLSKTYIITGWRIGYAVASKELTGGIRRVHDFLSGVAPTPFQIAGIVALRFEEKFYNDLLKLYTYKRKLLLDILQDTGLRCYTPQGAYYILADMSIYDFKDSVAFTEFLMKEIGVAAIPWTSFYFRRAIGKYKVRFTFSKKEEALREAARRLQKLKKIAKRKE